MTKKQLEEVTAAYNKLRDAVLKVDGNDWNNGCSCCADGYLESTDEWEAVLAACEDGQKEA